MVRRRDPDERALSLTQHARAATRDARAVGTTRTAPRPWLAAADAWEVASDAWREVGDLEKAERADGMAQTIIGLIRAAYGPTEDEGRPRKRRPSRTFATARAQLLAYLEQTGWDVRTAGPRGALKIPHATSPSGSFRLWFKPQAVHFTRAPHNVGDARSLWIDIRRASPEEVARAALRTVTL